MAKAEGVVFFQVEEYDSVPAEAEAAGARLLKPARKAFLGRLFGVLL